MKKSKIVFWVLLLLGAVAVTAIWQILLPNETDAMVVFLVGTLLCAWAASCMLERYRCKIKVTALFVDYGFEQYKAHLKSFPILSYRYGEKAYTETCGEALSQGYVLQHYKKGERYDIWLSAKDPTRIVLTRRIRISELLTLLLGLSCVALSLFSLLF